MVHDWTHLGLDVLESAFDLGDDDVFNRIDSTLRGLDNLVKRSERRLQRAKMNQHLDSLLPLPLAILDRLTTLSKAGELVGCNNKNTAWLLALSANQKSRHRGMQRYDPLLLTQTSPPRVVLIHGVGARNGK